MMKKTREFKHNVKWCWGRKVAFYINRNKKWLKIGVYCNKCGAVRINTEFLKGLPGSV